MTSNGKFKAIIAQLKKTGKAYDLKGRQKCGTLSTVTIIVEPKGRE